MPFNLYLIMFIGHVRMTLRHKGQPAQVGADMQSNIPAPDTPQQRQMPQLLRFALLLRDKKLSYFSSTCTIYNHLASH